MTLLKAGTPTSFQDKTGAVIKVGDRIKHKDGNIYVIDKYGQASSSLGFRHKLDTLTPITRGMYADGTYYARLATWTLTDEPMPSKPEGETVSPGNDADNMAPDRVRDPRNTSSWKKKHQSDLERMEAEAVENGVTVDEARAILEETADLDCYPDDDLADELRRRGFRGQLTKTITINL